MTAPAAIDPEGQRWFDRERPRLVAIAYRMTGTPDDADDVVQDVWLRWQRADRPTIDNPAAWLTTVTTRVAIDRLTSARARREVYVGPWLPEPLSPGRVGTDAVGTDPSEVVGTAESLSIGFLRVLETLTPVERAVFLLHDVFGYDFAEVAGTVERSPAAARQIAKRARERVRAGRPRVEPDPDDVESLSAAFLGAVLGGDIEHLLTLLNDDVVLLSDGGAERHAARRPVVGRERVARFLANLGRREYGTDDELEIVAVNGRPAFYLRRAGEPLLLLQLGWRDGKVAETLSILNPHKLARFDAGLRAPPEATDVTAAEPSE